MSSVHALAALSAVVVLLAIAGTAAADFSITAEWRETGPNSYEVVIRNNGDPFDRVRISSVPHSGCTPPAGGDCGPVDDETIQYVFLEAPVQTGDTVSLRFTTKEELPADKVLTVEVFGPDGDSAGFSAARRAQTRADLGVAISPIDPVKTDYLAMFQDNGHVVVAPLVRVTNHGPDAAEDVGLLIAYPTLPAVVDRAGPFLVGAEWRSETTYESLPGGGVRPSPIPGKSYLAITGIPDGCQRQNATSIRCSIGTLEPEATRRFLLLVRARRNGPIEVTGSVTSSTTDPGPRSNRDEFRDTVIELPDTGAPGCGRGGSVRTSGAGCNTKPRRIPAGTRPVFSGSARGAKAVDVAILRVERGVSAAGRRNAVCEWLASRGGRFVAGLSDGKQCLRPAALLTARGAGRWKLALRRPLPAGRYLMLTRGRGPGSVYESSFSERDGNRIELIVG